MKEVFTKDIVKERLPYARKPETFKRRGSFLASTNSEQFLTDVTGNVRWIDSQIDGIYHENGGKNGYNQNINIDQVWSQAYSLLNSGFEFKLTSHDIEKSEKINKDYQMVSFEAEFIQDCFKPSTKDDPNAVFKTIGDILLQIESKTRIKVTAKNIGMAMGHLGFIRGQKYFKDKGSQRKGPMFYD